MQNWGLDLNHDSVEWARVWMLCVNTAYSQSHPGGIPTNHIMIATMNISKIHKKKIHKTKLISRNLELQQDQGKISSP